MEEVSQSITDKCLELGDDPIERLWLAIRATQMLGPEGKPCECGCGARVFPKSTGRKRQYESNACRQRAYRLRSFVTELNRAA
jgi:hypothetical protein